VTSLDARALVSEIRQRVEESLEQQVWFYNLDHAVREMVSLHASRKSRSNLLAAISESCRVLKDDQRLLTAVLGLIEQQQEEIRGLSQGDI
jgi:hypothetical protein